MTSRTEIPQSTAPIKVPELGIMHVGVLQNAQETVVEGTISHQCLKETEAVVSALSSRTHVIVPVDEITTVLGEATTWRSTYSFRRIEKIVAGWLNTEAAALISMDDTAYENQHDSSEEKVNTQKGESR